MAVKIPAEVQPFLSGKEGWVATASKDGMPNLSIKGSLRMIDDEHLVFADINSKKTRRNLEENPRVAVMVYDAAARKGYMVRGTCEMHASGALYDEVTAGIRKAMPQLPPVQYVVRITVESVWDQSAGPTGGRQLA
ncbi:MAG TPA: pyridoxamine 5'-phosphate oxidase family protein [Spirochaetia bacterium]|nr:pyridoxamine 5'-phosphate oxidase family protein [Spirochaetia bacterium]